MISLQYRYNLVSVSCACREWKKVGHLILFESGRVWLWKEYCLVHKQCNKYVWLIGNRAANSKLMLLLFLCIFHYSANADKITEKCKHIDIILTCKQCMLCIFRGWWLWKHSKKWRGKPRKPWIDQCKDKDQRKENEKCHKVCQILLYEVY